MAITIEGDRNEINYCRDQADARRWRKLLEQIGDPRDGSDTTVSLFWDDATRTAFIQVGKRIYSVPDQGSFDNVIEGIDNEHARVPVSVLVSSRG